MFKKNTHYVSEYTEFMQQLLKDQPEMAQGQIEGRALLWDKAPINLDERQRNDASRIEQKPYPYQAD
ncbi:DUF3460 family protein [Andreprevotia chitinilytica]|uniref:DUF3460 family protein n=1 Tax=Andreprevotia chitinilytica TaxID=396808 RepID=UPI00054D5BA7|nr:DUF3460 family protein [Andreprevotia chitinilytica]